MRKYIGTKLIEAEPAHAYSYEDKNGTLVVSMTPKDAPKCSRLEKGYHVRYLDGYESWSPKDVFEMEYRPTDAMSFGLAIEAAKKGMKITRAGWNGKGQYVQLASCVSYINPDGEVVNADHSAIGNRAFAFVGTSGVQLGWLASQADMLADDWAIVE